MCRKKSNSFKAKAEDGGDGWSSPSSPRLQLDFSNALIPDSASKATMLHLAKQGSPATSPRSPKAAWDQVSLHQAQGLASLVHAPKPLAMQTHQSESQTSLLRMCGQLPGASSALASSQAYTGEAVQG